MNSSLINLCKCQSASTYKLSPVHDYRKLILNIIFLLEYTLVNVFVTGQILIEVKILNFLCFLNLIIHELGSREVEIENQPTLQILPEFNFDL